MGFELAADAVGRHHHTARGPVKAAQQCIGERSRRDVARGQIFGKAGVVGGGEIDPGMKAPAARCDANRSLGDDMDRVGARFLDDLADLADRVYREADFAIERARDGAESIGRERDDGVAQRFKFVRHGEHGSHDTVHLRRPGVAGQQDSHCSSSASSSSSRLDGLKGSNSRNSIQCRISRRPSKCSTSAEQLSTQSPSLQ